MERRIIILCLACLCASNTFAIQKSDRSKKPSHVVIPREIALPVVASQPESPVQFEKVQLVHDVNGGGVVAFQLRNTGTKPIRSVTFAVLYSHGSSWLDSRPRVLGTPLIMPGELVPLAEDDKQGMIVPLTNELRDKLKLRGPMQAVTVFMIVSVRFADGSTYNEEPTYRALKTYFEDVGSRIDR